MSIIDDAIKASRERDGKRAVEVEYIEKGTFQGGDEDCFNNDIAEGGTYFVLKAKDLEEMPRFRDALEMAVNQIEILAGADAEAWLLPVIARLKGEISPDSGKAG